MNRKPKIPSGAASAPTRLSASPSGSRPARVPAWHERAACSAPWVRMNWFFHEKDDTAEEKRDKTSAAKEVCRSCPPDVREACREYGDLYSPTHGLYGGMTAPERRKYNGQAAA